MSPIETPVVNGHLLVGAMISRKVSEQDSLRVLESARPSWMRNRGEAGREVS